MPPALKFETPENVQVQYQPAGLGTRFVAWFIDQFVLIVVMFFLMIALVIAGASFEFLDNAMQSDGNKDDDHVALYFVGLMILVWGLGSFVYFTCCELLLRGQTIGKRSSKIRVIKANGFQLDSSSILVRNLFRVIDHMPPMWIVPVISRLSQRAGDMVAGTIVVVDDTTEFSPVRVLLGERTAAEAEFRFDSSMLKRLNSSDYHAIERVLDRLTAMKPEAADELIRVYVTQIATKLGIDAPPPERQQRFLEDLLAAEFRRQDRSLA
jgi:uncharacterized RDD family membrane protein YckC